MLKLQGCRYYSTKFTCRCLAFVPKMGKFNSCESISLEIVKDVIDVYPEGVLNVLSVVMKPAVIHLTIFSGEILGNRYVLIHWRYITAGNKVIFSPL